MLISFSQVNIIIFVKNFLGLSLVIGSNIENIFIFLRFRSSFFISWESSSI